MDLTINSKATMTPGALCRYCLLAVGPTILGPLIALAAESGPPSKAPDPFEQNRRLGRGMNILGYDPIWGPVAGAEFREEHFRLIRQSGFQSVRICLFPFSNGQCTHNGWLSDAWLDKVDWAVKQALSQGLAAIVDYHESGDLGARPLRYREALLNGWKQLGERFKDSPPSVFFEILNEPHGELTPALWNRMFREALAAIRRSNPTRTVIVGPGGYNDIDYLEQLDLPENDRNIIVAVHYYSPTDFTHQGLRCFGREVPVGEAWNGTEQQRQAIVRDFEKAQAWALRNRRPMFLGEFGAYRKADMASRARWTDCVRQTAEKLGWSWAYWHFDAGFTLYDISGERWVEPIRDALIPRSFCVPRELEP